MFAVSFALKYCITKVSRALRSAGSHLLVEPRSRTVRYGDCSFAKAAPALWNKLPVSLHKNIICRGN